MNPRNTDRIFVALAFVSVAIAIATGFWLLGSPSKQRLISLDKDRVNHLQQIANEISREYGGELGETKPLPESLVDVNVRQSVLQDPATNEPYEYRRLSESTYALCATFATNSSESSERSYAYGYNDERWAHSQGQQCYELEASNRDPNP